MDVDWPRPGPTLEVFVDLACPFCWLVEPALDRLRQDGSVEIRYRALELRPSPAPFAEGGCRRAARKRAARIARAAGVPAPTRDPAVRTRRAHGAIACARVEGHADDLRRAVFAAHFRDGLDIGRSDVLARLGESVGLDAHALWSALHRGEFAGAVETDAARARTLGIDAVPAFAYTEDGQTRVRLGWMNEAELHRWLGSTTEMTTG